MAGMDLPSSGSDDEDYERSARADAEPQVQLVQVCARECLFLGGRAGSARGSGEP